MKKIFSKSIFIGLASLAGVSLISGSVFASYIVTQPNKLGARITLKDIEFDYSLLFTKNGVVTRKALSYDDENDAAVVPTGQTASFTKMEIDNNTTVKVQRNVHGESTYYDLKSYNITADGTYTFTSYNLSTDTLNFVQAQKAVYAWTANKYKTFKPLYLYAFNKATDVGESTFPGVSMSVYKVIDSGHAIYRSFVNMTSDTVIFSNRDVEDSRLQTGDLTIPTTYTRPTYNLVTLPSSAGGSAGQGTWGEYTASPTTVTETNPTANSDVILAGTMTATDWADDNQLYFEKCLDGNSNTQLRITLYLAAGTQFKAKNWGSWDWTAGYNSGLSSTYFENASGNVKVKTGQSGIYTLWVKDGAFVGAEKVAAFS